MGGRLVTRDSIAYWTPSSVRLLTNHFRASSQLCKRALTGPRAVAISNTGEIEILDGSGILRVSLKGGCAHRYSPNRSTEISSGAHTKNGWIWIERGSTGNRAMLLENGRRPLTSASRLLALNTDSARPMIVAPSQEGYAVALTVAPHSWGVFAGDSFVVGGHTFDSVDNPGSGLFGNAGSPQSRWITTGWFDLGEAFLEVLADLGSDRRRLVLYNLDGSLRRETVLSFPFGILDVDIKRRQILAVRRTKSLELVIYSWRWRVG